MKSEGPDLQGMGRLYSPITILSTQYNILIAEIRYTVSEWVSLRGGSSSMRWQGTFIPEGEHPKLEGTYIIELEDKRRGRLLITLIQKQTGIPTLYHFRGVTPLE